MNKATFVSISATYARAALASVAALFLAGETDLKVLAYAFAAGFVGPVLKALDPKATEYGRGTKKKK
jgi:hypothetical protein